MKLKLSIVALVCLFAVYAMSCSHERHHKDPHKKYKVYDEDSAHKVDMDDHMRDNQPH